MSMFEIVLPESPKFAEKLADQILTFLNDKGIEGCAPADLVAGVKALGNLDQFLEAAQLAYNDSAMVVNEFTIPDRANAQATMDILDEAYQQFAGQAFEEYSLLVDASAEEGDTDLEDDSVEIIPTYVL